MDSIHLKVHQNSQHMHNLQVTCVLEGWTFDCKDPEATAARQSIALESPRFADMNGSEPAPRLQGLGVLRRLKY